MRTFDATLLNTIANRDDVRFRLGWGSEKLDLSPIVKNPRNYAFQNDLGGFVCINTFGQTYEVHTIFTPERKGVESVVDLMFRAEFFMFTKTDCVELTSKVPEDNAGAERLANRFGFLNIGTQLNWDAGRSATLKRKTLEDWAKNAPESYIAGRNFHDTLEAAKLHTGATVPAHAEDNLHDAIVGASVLMVQGGQVRKGIGFYNYWASLSGYGQVNLVSETPPVIEMSDAVIGLEDGKLEVYLCR